jgi:hypothetical protein
VSRELAPSALSWPQVYVLPAPRSSTESHCPARTLSAALTSKNASATDDLKPEIVFPRNRLALAMAEGSPKKLTCSA